MGIQIKTQHDLEPIDKGPMDVPIYEDAGYVFYVKLADIPEPARSQFLASLHGAYGFRSNDTAYASEWIRWAEGQGW